MEPDHETRGLILTPGMKLALLGFQRDEITGHLIYLKLSQVIKEKKNKSILKKISNDELIHHNYWKGFTHENLMPRMVTVWFYFLVSKILGLSFGIKLMEKNEARTHQKYKKFLSVFPGLEEVMCDQQEHEDELIAMIDEERLAYTGSIVLGLSDAIVEITGALGGLTFALKDARLIAATGLVTGVAASLSMSASSYLSTSSEDNGRNPLKASIYTGITYLVTVSLLLFPYLLSGSLFVSLGWMIINALFIILCFTYYISVAKDRPFGKHFLKMALLAFSVAGVSFLAGHLIRLAFGFDI